MLTRRLLLLALPFALTGCAAIESLVNPLAPEGAHEAFVLTGKGVQQFQCVSDARGRYWRFVTPAADLRDEKGRSVARQGSDGNFFAKDGSMLSVKIEKHEKKQDPENLRGLLYKAVPRGKPGIFSDVVYVTRREAKGGVPLTGCSPSQLGSTLKVPFTAVYTFYRKH